MIPVAFAGGWAARLTTVFGGSLSDIDESHLERLVDQGTREDADLDFKEERYGNGDSERREFAADVAAMANDRGGVIVIGIRDEDDVAVELTPVPLASAEVGRMRSIGADNLAPYAAFYIAPVESLDHPGQGYYLVVVPPSSDRPHAVRKGIDLRYPRRHGPSKRWLSESEVADAYRDRFTRVGADVDRVYDVLEQGRGLMALTPDLPLLAFALAPSERGSLIVDAEALGRAEDRVRQPDFTGGQPPFEGPWAGLFPPIVAAGRRRLRIGTTDQHGGIDTHYTYAEVHTDGCAFMGVQLPGPLPAEIGLLPGQATDDDRLILVTQLTTHAVTYLQAAAKLSSELAGSFGDCAVLAALIGDNMRLVEYDGDSFPRLTRGSSAGPVFSPHTVTLDSLVDISPDLLIGARLICSDLVQAFGEPELRTITSTGELRLRVFPKGYHQMITAWAAGRRIALS
jgi:hypothetical protein